MKFGTFIRVCSEEISEIVLAIFIAWNQVFLNFIFLWTTFNPIFLCIKLLVKRIFKCHIKYKKSVPEYVLK